MAPKQPKEQNASFASHFKTATIVNIIFIVNIASFPLVLSKMEDMGMANLGVDIPMKFLVAMVLLMGSATTWISYQYAVSKSKKSQNS